MKKTVNVKTLAMTAAAVAVAGCAETTKATGGAGTPPEPSRTTHSSPAPASSPPAKAAAQVDENLARLQALDVVQVGGLVVDYPAGAMNCYGPCPGQEPAIEAAKQKAAERLASFVEKAEQAAKSPSPAPCDTAIDANIAALQGLKIVAVTGFAKTVPAQKPGCYAGGCAADIAAAKASDAQKACRLDAIVNGTKR